jgi:HEAT repeats
MVRRIGRRWAPVTLRKRAAALAKALFARPLPLAKEAEGTVRGFRRWQLILICLAAGCSSMPPPPTATPAAPRAAYLGDVIRMHGWPCEDVTDFHASAPQWTSVTCRDGHTYEVFLRADADWRAGERQTRLQPMLELGSQTKLLTAPDAAERRRAATALGKLGAAASPAVPALVEALADDNAAVRQAAARALGEIGPEASAAAPALTRALGDPNTGVREDAALALVAIRGK